MDSSVPQLVERLWKPGLMLVGAIAMIDIPAARFGWKTISTAYREAPKWVTYPLSAYLVAHLHGWIREDHDPLSRAGRLVAREPSVQ